jgi:subtilisin family serine protease
MWMSGQDIKATDTGVPSSVEQVTDQVQLADGTGSGTDQPLYLDQNGTPVYAFKEQDQLLHPAKPVIGQDGQPAASPYHQAATAQASSPTIQPGSNDLAHQQIISARHAAGSVQPQTSDHASTDQSGGGQFVTDGLIQGTNYLTSTADMVGWNLKSIKLDQVRGEYTGKGITVAVVDDGFNYGGNTDLTKNYNTGIDWDFRGNDADAKAEGTDFHGTMVSGLIAAARNGSGTVGVAENATIAGLRVGFGSAGDLSQMTNALLKAKIGDVVNNSWGFTSSFSDNPNSIYFKSMFAALDSDVTTGRGGLGTNVVFAAGNARQSNDNTDFHGLQGSRDVITVASYNQAGDVSYFSTKGANVLLAAPGENVLTDYQNGLAYGSGTSFAAPTVTGAVADMLEANKALGFRDVREILAYSSSLSPLSAAAKAGFITNGATTLNGGGLHFSNDLGFGALNVHDAVRLAEYWQDQQTAANRISSNVTFGAKAGVDVGATTLEVKVAQDINIETVTLNLNFSHPDLSKLSLSLISPTGVSSVLFDKGTVSGTSLSWSFNANAFMGEHSAGTWKIVVNDASADGKAVSIQGGSLTFGGDTSVNTQEIFTDALGTSSQTSVTLKDTAGVDTINASAVTSNSHIDLSGVTKTVIAGKTVNFAAGTVFEKAIGGDGNDEIFGNSSSNLLIGGRGDDKIYAGSGNATLIGAQGNDTLVAGSGKDVFQFDTVNADSGTDLLKGFKLGKDTIDLRAIFKGLLGSSLVSGGYLKIANDTTGSALISVDTDGSAGKAASMLTIAKVDGISAAKLAIGTDIWAV